MTSFPYPPDDPSGDWAVELPGEASIGEVLVWAKALAELPDAFLWLTFQDQDVTNIGSAGSTLDGTIILTLADGTVPMPNGDATTYNNRTGYVVVPDDTRLSLDGSRTVEMWLYPSTWTSGYYQVAVKGDEWLIMKNNSSLWRVEIYNASAVLHAAIELDVAFGSDIPADTWTQLVVVFNATLEIFTLYLNGAKVDDAHLNPSNDVAWDPSVVPSGTGPLGLISQAGDHTLGLIGTIGRVRMWDFALDAAAILAAYEDVTL